MTGPLVESQPVLTCRVGYLAVGGAFIPIVFAVAARIIWWERLGPGDEGALPFGITGIIEFTR